MLKTYLDLDQMLNGKCNLFPENKKAVAMALTQLIGLIIVLVVVATVFLFIFKPGLFDWERNLPDYNYDERDRLIEVSELTEVEVAGICPKEEESNIGFVGELSSKILGEQYLNFFNKEGNIAVRHKLYWRGGENDGKIWLLQGERDTLTERFDPDILIAEVVDNKIKVKEEFFDFDSDVHQKARFDEGWSNFFKDNLDFLIKLDGSYPAYNNKLCKILPDMDKSDFKLAWPLNIGEKIINIDLKLNEQKNGLGISEFSKYLGMDLTKIRYLYLKDQDNYVEIIGEKNWARDKRDIFRIYPDGSVWFFYEFKQRQGKCYSASGDYSPYNCINLKNEGGLLYRDNPHLFRDLTYGRHAQETNIRVNYWALKDKLK